MKLSKQIRLDNPYSKKVFPEYSKSELKKIAELLKSKGFSIDRLAGQCMRKAWNECTKEFEKY